MGGVHTKPGSSQTRKSIAEAVQSFVNAQTWVESKAIMKARRDALFAPEAPGLFALLMEQYAGKPGMREHIAQRSDLVARARTDGLRQPTPTSSRRIIRTFYITARNAAAYRGTPHCRGPRARCIRRPRE